MPGLLPRAMTAIVLVLLACEIAEAGPDLSKAEIAVPPRIAPMPPPPTTSSPPRSIGARAVLKSGSITNDDYPSLALRNEEEGTAIVTFTIGNDGRVSECFATGATALLNSHSCTLVKQRFVFAPARDVKGKALTERRTQRIKWTIPEDADDPWAATARLTAKSYGVRIALGIDTMGRVVGCKVEALTPDAERDRFICALATDQWTFPVDRNDAGQPILSVRIFGSVPGKTGEPLSF